MRFRFSIRSLLVLMTLTAVFTIPAIRHSTALYELLTRRQPTIKLPVVNFTTLPDVCVAEGDVLTVDGIRYQRLEGKMVVERDQEGNKGQDPKSDLVR